MIRKSWLRLLSVLLLAALIGTACGSDREDDSATDTGGDTETTEPAKADTIQFGDLESPCGDGDGGAAGEQGVAAGSSPRSELHAATTTKKAARTAVRRILYLPTGPP